MKLAVPFGRGLESMWLTQALVIDSQLKTLYCETFSDKTVDPEERRYVRYYQWVCFCLFLQVRGV